MEYTTRSRIGVCIIRFLVILLFLGVAYGQAPLAQVLGYVFAEQMDATVVPCHEFVEVLDQDLGLSFGCYTMWTTMEYAILKHDALVWFLSDVHWFRDWFGARNQVRYSMRFFSMDRPGMVEQRFFDVVIMDLHNTTLADRLKRRELLVVITELI